MKETQSVTSALEEPFSKSSRLRGVAEGVRHRCIAVEFQNHSQTISPSGTKKPVGSFFLFINTKGIVELQCNSHYCGLNANSCSCSWAFSCFLFFRSLCRCCFVVSVSCKQEEHSQKLKIKKSQKSQPHSVSFQNRFTH